MTMDPYQKNDPNLQKNYLPPSTGPRKKTEEEAIRELGTKMGDPYQQNDPNLQQRDDVPMPIDGHKDYQGYEVPRAFIEHLIPSGAKLLGNLGQAITHPLDTANSILDTIGGIPLALMPEDWRNKITKDNPVAQGMLDDTNALIQTKKDQYGSPQRIANTLAEDPFTPISDLATVLAPFNGAIGAAATAARIPGPVIDAAAIAANPTRAVEGPAQAMGHGVRAVRNAMDPRGQFMLRAAEGQENALVAPLRAPQVHVQGSEPTTMQALDDTPNPPVRLVAAVKDAEKLRGTERNAALGDQNAARFQAVDAVVPHQDLPAAIAARDAQAAQDYANAGVMRDPRNPPPHPVANVVIPDDAALRAIAESPSVDRVFARARELAAEHRMPFQTGETTPGGPTPSGVLGPDGRPVMYNAPPTFAEYPAQSLHFVKQAYDDLITDPERFGIGASEVRALRGTRADFIDWFENRNTPYRAARENFRNASTPIDQTTLLNYYRAKLSNLVTGEDASKLNAAAFAGARDNALNEAMGNNSISKATGEKRVRHERDLLTPEQMQALDSVQADLGRAKSAEELASTPSAYSGELANVSDGIQLPGFLNPALTGVNWLLRTMTGHANAQNANVLADGLMTPAGTADLLEQAIARRAFDDGASRLFQVPGRIIQGANRVPAVYNALEIERQEREKRNKTSR